MIPTFPEFKKIEISDQAEIENFTKDFPPYSDFDFGALFCWDVENKRQVSMLNGNLIVKFTDDTTGKEFLSFLGINDVSNTVNQLFEYAHSYGYKPILRMIPQEIANFYLDHDSSADTKEDRDNFDYIYSIPELCAYAGSKFGKIRNLHGRFLRDYENRYRVESFDLSVLNTHTTLERLWGNWCEIKETFSERESIAKNRLLNNVSTFNLINVMIFVDDKPIAFTVNGVMNKEYAITYFSKTNSLYYGINAMLMRETAKELNKKNYKFLNYEEDLGLPGLRHAKQSYQPLFFLKKYTIEHKRGTLKRFFNVL